MNKKSLIKFFLKYILPPILIIIYFTISGYLKTGIIASLSWDTFLYFF